MLFTPCAIKFWMVKRGQVDRRGWGFIIRCMMTSRRSDSGGRGGGRAVWFGLGLILVAGCGPAARLELMQPQLTGLQAHLSLRSERAFWAPGKKMERLLVEFPPPGASTGRPFFFLLYLQWSRGLDRPGVGQGPHAEARGFLIQTRGRLAGLAAIVEGSLTVRGRSDSPGAKRYLEFDLRCEDGSHLVGRVEARREDWVLKDFETRRRPVDVANLAASAPA